MSEQKIEVGSVWKYHGGMLATILGFNERHIAVQYENRGMDVIAYSEFKEKYALIKHADGSPVEPESEYEELPVVIHNKRHTAKDTKGNYYSLNYWQNDAGFDGFKYTNGTVSSIAPMYAGGDGYLFNQKKPGRKTVWPKCVVIKKEKQ